MGSSHTHDHYFQGHEEFSRAFLQKNEQKGESTPSCKNVGTSAQHHLVVL
ncbi:hypothetical protein [Candidatus Nitrososphaera evergladensis]|nr:hypothetical protein [Candidatus Nitrososphaera evergladensis]